MKTPRGFSEGGHKEVTPGKADPPGRSSNFLVEDLNFICSRAFLTPGKILSGSISLAFRMRLDILVRSIIRLIKMRKAALVGIC
jgi:hypothetical protein